MVSLYPVTLIKLILWVIRLEFGNLTIKAQ